MEYVVTQELHRDPNYEATTNAQITTLEFREE